MIKTPPPATIRRSSFPTLFPLTARWWKGRRYARGYSRAMQLLLHEAGMKATLVGGFDDQNVAHMWNMVTIDGRNYHLDATWDDSEDYPRHTFFNLTTEEILRTTGWTGRTSVWIPAPLWMPTITAGRGIF